MYQIVSVLGNGTYGKVYQVSELLSRRSWALKRLLISPKTKGDYIMSLREIDMMTRLRHPHVLPLAKVLFTPPAWSPLEDMDDDQVSLLLPQGQSTVDTYIDSSTITNRKHLVWQLLVGLQHIHRHNVIHRDLKPQNLIIFNTPQGDHLCIGDFGLAAPYVRGEPRTPQMVTVWYRAPEILWGEDYDYKSDIWSVGCICAELIGGRPIFCEDTESRMSTSILALLDPLKLSSNVDITTYHRYRVQVDYPDLNTVEMILHRKLGLNKEQIVEFNQTPGTYKQYLTLLSLMLNLDPQRRPDCTYLLKQPFFDSYRPRIAVMVQPRPIAYRLHLHPQRQVGIELFDQQTYPLQYRVKFLALDILDRILVADSEIGDDAAATRRYAICALYIAEKYLLMEQCCAFHQLTSTCSDDFVDYRKREEYVLRTLLRYQIYRPTLYDYLPANAIRHEISRAYLLFRQALGFNGIRLDELYSIYVYVVEKYHCSENSENEGKMVTIPLISVGGE